MTTKLALILTGIWTLLVAGACGGGIWFVTNHVPRHQQDERAKMLGGATGGVALVGYAAIIFPWAIAWRRKRVEAEQAALEERRAQRAARKRAGGRTREPDED